MKVKIFTPEFLEEIGFTLVYEKPPKNPKRPLDIYGCAVRRGMTHLYWHEEGYSCTYYGEDNEPNTSLSIRKDADTRNAFNGYVFTQDDVRRLLKLTN